MKNLFLNLKTIIFCFLVLFSVSTQAQVINESFEETQWATSGAAQANQTVNVNTGAINTGSWIYNNAYVNTASAATFVRTGSNSFFLAGSSSAFICTPLISAGVSQVTVVVKSATGTAASMVIGVATNTAVTANTGSISSTAAGAAWSVGSSTYGGLPVSTDAWSTITFTTNLTAPAYVKIQRITTGSIYIDDIVITGMVAVPTLVVAPATRTGFTYIVGAGPSANQTFTVTGSNLTANATLTAPADYEIATAAGGPYSTSLTLNQVAGNIALTTIYARLEAGKAVALYNGQTVTVASAGAVSQTVTLSGSVTAGALTPLAAPAVGAASGISSSGFTANWSTVANASGGYIVNVYQGAALVKTVNVAGQASTNTIVTGLNASTTYTYKVIAVGDGLTWSNSPESAASAAFSTSAPSGPSSSCDLPLYNTDFKDWGNITYSSSSSNPFTLGPIGGAGQGFIITEDASVDNAIGKYWIEGSASGRILETKPFNILPGSAGAYVELDFELNNDGSNRVIDFANQTATQVAVTNINLTGGAYDLVNLKANATSMGTGTTPNANVNTWIAGSTIQLPKSAIGRITIAYYIPGISGSQTFQIQTLRTLMPLRGIKVCNMIGGLKYVASTSYAACATDGTGLSITGTKGAAVPVSGTLNIKGYNITGPVTLSIAGTDAGLFSLPVTSIPQATALAGTSVTVNFMPSVLAGVSKAQLIISSAGAPNYCVSLTGLTQTGASAEITTPVQTWNFPTSFIAPKTQDITISGVNLTGPVTFTLMGANAAQFSLSSSSVSLAQALAGTPIQVTYLGGISAPLTQNATLRLSSPGAPNVDIPLVGLTYSIPPTMYTLDKVVTPAGTGFITQDLGGSEFAVGTTVRVTAVPQTGYKFKRWTDNGSTALTRSVLMMSDMQIIAEFELGTPPAVAPFNAYTPLVVGNNTFTARWGTDTGATSYTVKVYDSSGALIYTSPAQGAAVRSFVIPGAAGLTAGSRYTYTVTGGGTGNVSNVVGPILTTGGVGPACGSVG